LERKRRRGCAGKRDFDFGINPIYDAGCAEKDRKGVGLLFDRLRKLGLPAFPGSKVVLVEPDFSPASLAAGEFSIPDAAPAATDFQEDVDTVRSVDELTEKVSAFCANALEAVQSIRSYRKGHAERQHSSATYAGRNGGGKRVPHS
jgi:hypothetical protein